MAKRDSTFLLKRSNVAGNKPVAGQILLGELALNTADVMLYASGTSSGSILPIGWDRVSRTGDTMSGALYVPTISATTYLNLPLDIYVTGGTYSAGSVTFKRNDNTTFNVTGFNTKLGTVTSVAALNLGTTGSDLSSTVATNTTTPVITLNVPNSSSTSRGVLKSADWSLFNSKQAALSGTGYVKVSSGGIVSYTNTEFYEASNPNGFTTNTGTVKQVNAGAGMEFANFDVYGDINLGKPTEITLISSNDLTSTSHSHKFNPGGDSGQYIAGNGTLVNFPTIPSGTNLTVGVSNSTTLRIDSSTGSNVVLPVATESVAGIVNASTQTFAGAKRFEDGLVVGFGAQSYPLHVTSESLSVSIYAAYDIVAYSDISVKENIRPIDNVVDRIKKSRGVVYDRIDNGALDNIGFIAQELEEQFPELVVDNGDGTKAVKYQNGVAVLFEAIKEQQVQIDDLKDKLNNVLKLLKL